MDKTVQLEVKDDFLVSPFYKKNDLLLVQPQRSMEDLLEFPFIIDMYFEIFSIQAPWLYKPYMLMIYDKWKRDEQGIAKLFKKRRSHECSELMRIHIAAFIDFLFWINKQRVDSLKNLPVDVSQLRIKPVNCMERLNYIINKHNQFQSFILLQQLFDEVFKTYQIEEAKKDNPLY
ncbi:hypothetical protein CIB95_07540 [Lottiidibacillus patelloidae]|uniref:YpoC-like domain-containing protein n=1 Tax=Lottiidibacillus patelloidae TaxID=2670334 RepID=A0A263BUB1_9BACI|nr:hypothetical protein [Lottiidibacillus patelloidae]OZM57309.1 hypothetical protein CIB95_07540 [Lottiidibacillus patelloidae]